MQKQKTFDADTLLDWLDGVEHSFEWKELQEGRKVKIFTIKLKGATLVWQKVLQANRVGKEKDLNMATNEIKIKIQVLAF